MVVSNVSFELTSLNSVILLMFQAKNAPTKSLREAPKKADRYVDVAGHGGEHRMRHSKRGAGTLGKSPRYFLQTDCCTFRCFMITVTVCGLIVGSLALFCYLQPVGSAVECQQIIDSILRQLGLITG